MCSTLLTIACCGLATFALIREFDGKPLLLPSAFGVALAVGLYCLLSTRYALTLGVLMLFIGLADGYLKLRFGGLAVTGLRDVSFSPSRLVHSCASSATRSRSTGPR